MIVCTATGLAEDAAEELTSRGTVVDLNQKPIPGAQITLHRWDGTMSPALQTTTSDTSGNFEFPPRENDRSYYYVAVRKVPYAPFMQIVRPEGPVKVSLRPATNTWIEVRSAAGKPLKGARVTSISIRTQENTEMNLWRGMEHLLGMEFTPSNDAGRLDLPPLPEGAIVDIRIDHPQWAQVKLSNAIVAEGRLNEVSMPAGVMTTFEFVADSRTPISLEGLVCETSLQAQSSDSAETINRIPMTIAGNQIRFCAHPVTYGVARLNGSGVAITPEFDRLTISRNAEMKVRFLVRKTVNVSGRVLHRDGTPHKGARIQAQIENLSPDGKIPGTNEWAYSGFTETDAEGKFTAALAPGRGRIEAHSNGFVTDRDYAELDVRAEGPNEIPVFTTEALQPVRGQVVDENDRPVPGAIVRLRFPSLWRQPEVTDAEGRFEISLPWIPLDLTTHQRRYALDVAAFIADQPLMGVTRIDLHNADPLKIAKIVLRPQSSADALLSMEDNAWSLARKQKVAAEQTAEEKHPAGERGQPAPELDGAAWYNTDAKSLKDFRGRYVLLDFWFIGCGPCHADFPSVKLVDERFEKHGVTVIGVHDNSSTPEAVREHCQKLGLKFPIVVDHPDGRILNAYRQLGVKIFPSYILIGPDGKILENDKTTDGPSLRSFKLEVIRKYVLDQRN